MKSNGSATFEQNMHFVVGVSVPSCWQKSLWTDRIQSGHTSVSLSGGNTKNVRQIAWWKKWRGSTHCLFIALKPPLHTPADRNAQFTSLFFAMTPDASRRTQVPISGLENWWPEEKWKWWKISGGIFDYSTSLVHINLDCSIFCRTCSLCHCRIVTISELQSNNYLEHFRTMNPPWGLWHLLELLTAVLFAVPILCASSAHCKGLKFVVCDVKQMWPKQLFIFPQWQSVAIVFFTAETTNCCAQQISKWTEYI